MGSLELAHDPKEWGSQVEEYLPARYRMKAEAAEKAIRAVAQKFVGTDRADDLFKRRSDLFDRCGILDEIVDAVCVPVSQRPAPKSKVTHLFSAGHLRLPRVYPRRARAPRPGSSQVPPPSLQQYDEDRHQEVVPLAARLA